MGAELLTLGRPKVEERLQEAMGSPRKDSPVIDSSS